MTKNQSLHTDPLVAAAAQKIIDVSFNKAAIDEEVKQQNAILGRYVKVAKAEGVTDEEIKAWKEEGLKQYKAEKEAQAAADAKAKAEQDAASEKKKGE